MSVDEPVATRRARARRAPAGRAIAPEDVASSPHAVARIVEPEPHPLTTPAAPLLPPRHAPDHPADVWEELDRAAAWVCDARPADEPPGREAVRHGLRVVCVALRAHVVGGMPLRAQDVPWQVPVVELLAALRRRLVAQSAAPEDGAAADPTAVLAVLAAMDRLESAALADVARSTVDQLSGAQALELLVEVAHDMRSPLGSILALVERLRVGASGTEARALGLVYGAALGLSTMVGDVMELARGGDRLAGGVPAPFAIGDVLAEVGAIVRPIAEEKGLTLELGVAPAGRWLGHGAAVHRVLLNLVTNALKFTREGGVAVRVERVADGVAFTVRDTGPGIPPAVQAQLFTAFRARATGAGTAFSSAGLGLAICRKLVGTMGGELAVTSRDGEGTRFQFALPLVPA